MSTLYYPIKPLAEYPSPGEHLSLLTEGDFAAEVWNYVWLNMPWLDRPGQKWTRDRIKHLRACKGEMGMHTLGIDTQFVEVMRDGANAFEFVDHLADSRYLKGLHGYREMGDDWIKELASRAAISVRGDLYRDNVTVFDFKQKRRVA